MEIKNELAELKVVNTKDYNYIFNRHDGTFMRWGKTYDEDPEYSPLGPEILDIEISTICHQGCSFCYKSNTGQGKNMDLATFKAIFHKFPKNLTQIAFGIGSIDSNPDLWDIMRYCRENDYNKVVPNITINGFRMHDYYYWQLVKLCGAVAVSNYTKESCYGTVQRLIRWRDVHREEGMPGTLQQVNIHQLLCEETYEKCFDLMHDVKNDERLKGLNAVVFLLLKPKGKRNCFHQIRSLDKYRKLIDFALENNIPIGFDSCTAPSFLKAIEGRDHATAYEECCEPCESNCFSSYVNVDGRYFHCSFTEDQPGWDGIDLLQIDDFMTEVWHHPEVERFRGKLSDSAKCNGCRSCPIFDLEMK